jgi:transglutaminase-like putative cysteine protease
MRSLLAPLILTAFGLSISAGGAAPDTASEPRVRTFRFTYAAIVTGLEPGQRARVWLPVPSSGDDQDVEIVSKDLPAKGRIETEPRYRNRILSVEAKADRQGEISVRMVYRIKRREVRGDRSRELKEDAKQLARLLRPDARVPIDGKPLDLLKGKKLPDDEMAAARVFYDVVNGHMRYSKEGIGWGNGDSVWACEKGYGNCSDFHSLFISLARSRSIPATFEIGFSLPAERGSGDIPSYHCWAKFHSKGKGWVPVDISEANKDPGRRDYYFGNLTQDRVAFSTGRDLDLVPRQSGPPLNFFVYPYVEVDGKEYPQAKIKRRFRFRDEGNK